MHQYQLFLFAAVASAAPSQQKTDKYVSMPILFKYGNYPRISADIKWGTPAQTPVSAVVDTGSAGFWVYGPNSTINDGSNYLFVPGPCNKSVQNFYNWPASSSAKNKKPANLAYAYGGNGKIVSGGATIVDSMSFTNDKWPAIVSQKVGLANHTLVKQLDQDCRIPESSFDHSILGLAPPKKGLIGVSPSFRTDLAARTSVSSVFSMWFDRAPAAANGTFQGTLLLGALPPKSKYSGDLVGIKVDPPENTYLGYYVSAPTVSVAHVSKPKSTAKKIKSSDASVKRCFVDSGTGEDGLAIDEDAFLSASGLIKYNIDDQLFIAYNGTCDNIPRNATIDFSFPAVKGGVATVKIPLRNYARGSLDEMEGADKNVCGLSMTLGNSDCVLGAPFFSGAMLAFGDNPTQVAIAQGGVSKGAQKGPSGIEKVKVVSKGQKLLDVI
ncbi:aspartic peptidase domain-containing protein [Elsinoe ampelina]|uniref:Aspartic peptidase domain-containing protein n=1 Tax=Elsinoe ampelina TaxID=302913 RepID=A0A6A6GPJ2_9PEZI|nr:aspartic peptidase domain-containing protein [Elsinoe ampelina]